MVYQISSESATFYRRHYKNCFGFFFSWTQCIFQMVKFLVSFLETLKYSCQKNLESILIVSCKFGEIFTSSF